MKKLLVLFFLLLSLSGLAQDKQQVTEADYSNNSIEMADQMRANGKIYVVVAVIMTLFAGLLAYLIHTERKISSLEKELKLRN